ncbi:response regulator transcription factor [Tindallia californiensis]|uniref:Stage 0 sporulation protein A homolog n=1 Tax=Tindallia californiensis TaxID=159292 RepID=A0A1H3QQ67_9FIRM|nr:response regulator [Tindallia californiensis]SDZ14859.1 Helix-turn-helix domain-containing protein [Tindallia californiensis]
MFKVLIADDEPKIRKGLKRWIEESSYSFQVVAEARNGKEALECTLATSPEVIFVDINMPVMNGLDYISQVKKACPGSLIVIISGHDEFKYAHKAIKYKVLDYLLKPVSKNEFNLLLKNAMEILDEKVAELEREDKVDEILKYSYLVKSVKEYIDQHFTDPQLNLVQTAQVFDVSSSHLSKRMKNELGKTFVEYLTEKRLNKAKEILTNQYDRVTIFNVSKRVGYTSQHYFSRVFKKTYGVSPMDYRRNKQYH